MKNKIMVFVISLIITLTAFMFILYIEKKLLNPNGTTKVYVVKAEKVDKGQVIDDKNFENLFTEDERRNEQLVPGYIENKEDLLNTTVMENLYKNEVATAKKLERTDDILKDIENKREITIKCSDFADAAGGTLREGDRVDIFNTSTSNSKVRTEPLLQNVYVYKALSSDGSEIDRKDKNKMATAMKFMVSPRDAAIIQNASVTGKLKLIKVVEESEYEKFFIENQKN